MTPTSRQSQPPREPERAGLQRRVGSAERNGNTSRLQGSHPPAACARSQEKPEPERATTGRSRRCTRVCQLATTMPPTSCLRQPLTEPERERAAMGTPHSYARCGPHAPHLNDSPGSGTGCCLPGARSAGCMSHTCSALRTHPIDCPLFSVWCCLITTFFAPFGSSCFHRRAGGGCYYI